MKRETNFVSGTNLKIERLVGLALLALLACSNVAGAQHWQAAPASSIAAQMAPVFGPTRYVLSAGPPQTLTAAFKIVKPAVLADQNQLITRLALEPGSFATAESQCLTSPIILSLGDAGTSVPNPPNPATPLLSAVSIVNTGTANAQNVEVTVITLPGGTLTSPVSFPYSLGTIAAGGAAVLDADFSGGPFPPAGNPYPLTVAGTYTVNSVLYCFALTTDLVVPPAAPGSAASRTVQLQSHYVSSGGFLPQPIDFDGDLNASSPSVPIAPFVPLIAPSPQTNAIQAANALPATIGGPLAIVLDANNGLGIPTAGANCDKNKGVCAEPSGDVTGGGFVFATANWRAAYSTDGITFTTVDSRTIFPHDGFKFCCDQIVIYASSINRFIWLLQNHNALTGGQGGYRLAMASPEDILSSNGKAWTYWNLTWNSFVGCTTFDYPDLALGDNYLYMSWNARCPDPKGRLVGRTLLSGIKAGGTIEIGYTDPALATMANSDHLTQNTGNEIFWAGHKTNTHMRVFYWPDNSNSYSWSDVGISSWAPKAHPSKTPDGVDWLAKNFGKGQEGGPENSVIGATRNGNDLWFAWIAGTDSNFPWAHVEMVQLHRSVDKSGNEVFSNVQQVQIWNKDYAYAYPALATNACTKEIGLSLEYGGGKVYENHVVGIWGDYNVHITTASDKGDDHFGDFVTIRRATANAANPGNLFAAFGFGVNKDSSSKTGSDADIRYVLFGRPASSCPAIK